MTRFIEIHNEKESRLIKSEDLPIKVCLIGKKIKLIDDENGQSEKNNLCGYIAEQEGHLYFQPESSQVNIFHNDEWIETSVWIKSGDSIRIEDQFIIYTVSGDRIEIRVMDKLDLEEKVVVNKQPKINIASEQTEKNYKVSRDNNSNIQPSSSIISPKIKKLVISLLLIVLLLIAIFIMVSEAVTIEIKPNADEIQVEGLIPVVKLNNRYVVVKGSYQLSAIKEGYKPLDKIIKIDRNNREFNFILQEYPGLVTFNITPKVNNEIYINNILLGNSVNSENKIIEYEIEKGEHQLKIISEGYKPYQQLIKIAGKNTKQEFFPVLQPDWGTVKIITTPEQAKIRIVSETGENKQTDSQEQLNTPLELQLKEGQYQLIVEKEGFKDKNMTFNVLAEENKQLEIKLEPLNVAVEIISNPDDALLLIDGHYYGKTPMQINLAPGVEYELELNALGYQDYKEKISIENFEENKLEFKLKEKTAKVFISTSPRQAKIYINGSLQKKSSGQFILKGFENTITVKAPGYKTQIKKIMLNDYTRQLNFELKKTSTSNITNKTDTVKTNNTVKTKHIKSASSQQRKQYSNSLGQNMILVYGTQFKMGSSKKERGRRSNEPEHDVKLDYDFYLSEKEVTNREYRHFKPTHHSGHSQGLILNLDSQPVVNISWNDAAKFANWLSKKEGLTPFYKEQKGEMVAVDLKEKSNGYRLPFEVEWELSARGSGQKKYPWGNQFPPEKMSGNWADESTSSFFSNYLNGYNDQQKVTSVGGFYHVNEQGFYDMGGNVSEWCQDFYDPNLSLSIMNKVQLNPTGPHTGKHKVVRDSSWRDSSITELRLSYRGYSRNAKDDIGFRLARYAK